uniref:Sulfotransfer_1 domain-containing protein n=1 Tax=Heterorhabditis bacteriophora TaxID=37862 RepID=A0A1I7X5S8_HETBA
MDVKSHNCMIKTTFEPKIYLDICKIPNINFVQLVFKILLISFHNPVKSHFHNTELLRNRNTFLSLLVHSFGHSLTVVIEKTPGYFTSTFAAKRVHELNPTMKIILIVRDPVQRTISDFTQLDFLRFNLLLKNKDFYIYKCTKRKAPLIIA